MRGENDELSAALPPGPVLDTARLLLGASIRLIDEATASVSV